MNNINIISSDCLGSMIYKNILKESYPNQFMSTLFNAKDFNKLIKNFKNINFENIKSFTLNTINWNKGEKTYGLIVDNKFKFIFPHHNNLNEIMELYKKRSERLIDNNLVFIMSQRICKPELHIEYTYKDMLNFIKLKTPYKRILLTTYEDLKKYETDTCKIFIKERIHTYDKIEELSEIVWKNYKDYIINK